MKKISSLLLLFFITIFQSSNAQSIRYVDSSIVTSGDGTSWITAYKTLSDALTDAANNLTIKEIYIAKGTYYPTGAQSGSNRDSSFLILRGLRLYGGFSPGGSYRNMLVNPTILSGDIGNHADNSDNSYHVMIVAGVLSNTGMVILEGLQISWGNASGSGSKTYNGKSISRSKGGGIYWSGNENNGEINIRNFIISGNRASDAGAGMCIESSSPKIFNSVFSGNYANYGGAVINGSSNPSFLNCTIVGNYDNHGGGGMRNSSSTPFIANTIIYGNNGGISNNSSTPKITYSLVQGITTGSPGSMNLNGNTTNPLFVSPVSSGTVNVDGDYRLQSSSPCVNKGATGYYTGYGGNTNYDGDIWGNRRLWDFVVDIGAYESVYTSVGADDIIYVKKNNAGTGSTWENALPELAEALKVAKTNTAIKEIWVAGGIYYPLFSPADDNFGIRTNRGNSFLLVNNVKVYGGFAGNETSLSQRNLSLTANKSTLSGDIGKVNDNSDNAYHIVLSFQDVGTAELNGFDIKNGNANDNTNSIEVSGLTLISMNGGGICNKNSSPILANLTISGNNAYSGAGVYNNEASPIINNVSVTANAAANAGGGIYNYYSSPVLTNVIVNGNTGGDGGGIHNYESSPILTNVNISGNTGTNWGGGIYNYESSPMLTNVNISGNSAGSGGGIHNTISSSPVLTNVTISGNKANDGGGIYNHYSSPHIRNTIIYNNSDGISNSSSPSDIKNSLVQGSSNTNDGNINGNKDPKFVTPVDFSNAPFVTGDYRLHTSSAAINLGNNTFFAGLNVNTKDLAGNPRVYNFASSGVIDMGAFEYQGIPTMPSASGIIYVKPGGTGNGSSWLNATSHLAEALKNSSSISDIKQIWVAGGTYQPRNRADNFNADNPDDPNNAFVLVKDVKIYGSFAGTESLLSQRDLTLTTNKSTLSGNLGAVNDKSDNAYHVVISSGDMGIAALDGFEIKDGNAYGNGTSIQVLGKNISNRSGGGIYIQNSSPVLTNMSIKGNNAEFGGGIYNDFSTPVFNKITIIENNAGYGGGIQNEYSNPKLINVTISGNTASSEGGGIGNYYSSPILTNVLISGNKAGGRGGGINNENASPWLTNVTICGNNAGLGGAMNNYFSGPTIRNSIIYENSQGINDEDFGSGASIYYSLVQGMSGSYSNNINGAINPLFVSKPSFNLAPFSDGDYHLQYGSPVINKGSNSYFTVGLTPDLSSITTDLDGNPRINDIIDLGAYEFRSNPLPIAIINYTAQAEANRAKLKWTTVTESNNKEFIISRSADGKSFGEIGTVAGAGNSSSTKNYVYFDENPLSGINFYQLSQMDYDGHKTDVGIRTVNFASMANNLIKVYPNPVLKLVRIDFVANTYNQLELTDVSGKVLQQMPLSTIDTEKKMDMSNLASGVYFIKFIGNDKVESRKVIKE